MTPKEKARELVERYLKKIIELAYAETKSKELAKQCALICVDEILNIYQLDEYAFWKEVKQELLKL